MSLPFAVTATPTPSLTLSPFPFCCRRGKKVPGGHPAVGQRRGQRDDAASPGPRQGGADYPADVDDEEESETDLSGAEESRHPRPW